MEQMPEFRVLNPPDNDKTPITGAKNNHMKPKNQIYTYCREFIYILLSQEKQYRRRPMAHL